MSITAALYPEPGADRVGDDAIQAFLIPAVGAILQPRGYCSYYYQAANPFGLL